MKLYFFFITIVSLCLVSCRKECQYKSLPDIECSDGYDLVNDAIKGGNSIAIYYGSQPNYIINDDSTYLALANSFYLPFDSIDFNAKTLLGLEFESNPGSSFSVHSYLCHNSNNNIWKFTAEYSIGGQCQGSQIEPFGCSFWYLCPKIPATDSVIFEVIDINPFPD